MSIVIYRLNPQKVSEKWKNYYIGESTYDQKNFNKKIVKYPQLWNSGYRLVRYSQSQDGRLKYIENKNLIMFLLVNDRLEIGDLVLSNCKRIGSLDTGNVLIMDGQACQVNGSYEVLIGDKNAAAVILVKNGNNNNLIIVLDTAFLSQNSPQKNAQWLVDLIQTNKKNGNDE